MYRPACASCDKAGTNKLSSPIPVVSGMSSAMAPIGQPPPGRAGIELGKARGRSLVKTAAPLAVVTQTGELHRASWHASSCASESRQIGTQDADHDALDLPRLRAQIDLERREIGVGGLQPQPGSLAAIEFDRRLIV